MTVSRRRPGVWNRPDPCDYHIWTYNPRFYSLEQARSQRPCNYHIWTYNPRFYSLEQARHSDQREAGEEKAALEAKQREYATLVSTLQASNEVVTPARDQHRVAALQADLHVMERELELEKRKAR